MRVVVAFQYDRPAAAQPVRHIARHKAEIGRKPEPAFTVGQYVADTVRRVVRRFKGLNIHVPHPERLATFKYVQPVAAERLLLRKRLRRAARGKHRRARFLQEHRQALHMVDMLVRKQHGRQVVQPQSDRRERGRDLAQGHPQINQNCGASGHIQAAVAGRAACNAVIIPFRH